MPERPAVVTIGNFDGVHKGHQALLRQAVERARALGVRSFAATFFPHPRAVLQPERPVEYLTDPDEKVALMRAAGVDEVWVCPFTRELSRLEPEEFIQLLERRQAIQELWVGSDFALGRNRSGTLAVLAEIGRRRGFAAHMVPPVAAEGRVISSTAIRQALRDGAVELAGELLGRRYSVTGELERTADGVARLVVPRERALPGPGVYAGCLGAGASERPVQVRVAPDRAGLELQASDGRNELPSGHAEVSFVRRLGA